MKRSSLVIFLCFIYGIALAQKTAVDAKQGEVTITGKIGNINPPKQIWIYMGNTSQWDSIIVKDGVFEYKNTTLLPAYGAIMIKYKPYYKGVEGYKSFFTDMNLKNMFFEAGHMEINSPVDTLKKYAVIRGSASALQQQYEQYIKKEGDILRDQKKLAANFNQATPEQLQSTTFLANYEKQNANIQKRLDSLIQSQINVYPKSLVSQMAFFKYLGKHADNIQPETAKGIYNQFSQKIKESERGKNMVKMIDNIGKPKKEIPVIAVGDIAPEFEQLNLKRKPVKLSDFRGQYVLLDFWASWCKPCRKANPDLVKLYQQFKSDKFTVLGVSLDNDEEKWKKAIAVDQLDWYHVSDLKGWKNEVAQQYGIMGIPQNLLIGPDGKVILKNARVSELAAKLSVLPL